MSCMITENMSVFENSSEYSTGSKWNLDDEYIEYSSIETQTTSGQD